MAKSMSMSVAKSVVMRMELTRRTAEAAVSNGAIFRPSSIRIRPLVGSAIIASDETHRHGADGRGAHQRQDDTARSFHCCGPRKFKESVDDLSFRGNEASESQPFTDSCGTRLVATVAPA